MFSFAGPPPDKNPYSALTREAEWLGCPPAKLKIASLISGQGTCLSCRFGSLVGMSTRGNQSIFLSHIDVSLPLFLSPFPFSLK